MTTQSPTIATSSGSQGESRTQAQQYVERQLLQTGRQVIANDVVMTLVGALSWVVGWLVFCIVIDAWVFPLTISMRWIALIVLLAGIFGWLTYCLYPIFFRRINPAYSAVMIEKSKEKFHNSLLNYTYLQAEQREVNQHVLQIVTQKAAQDLSQVAGLERVDRSGVIRLGALFAGLVGLFVVYTIFSSKSPWASIARICLPNADIQRPASVSIVEVQPGDTDVFFGRRLLVSCQVKGKHDPESVVVVLSTEDGRLVDVRQAMSPAGELSGSYQAELSTSPKGIDTSFRYRIEAGDGQTRDYHVKVNMNPTISVDSIKIKSPAYTKIPERTLNSFSNLSGVEGARVTVSAVANLPIASASIELLNLPYGAIAQAGTVVSTIKMAAIENQAEGEFVLTFNRRANQPDFTHFQLRFTSQSGDRNEITNVYAFRIIPDLGPEIRIVKPSEKEIRIPANQQASIEVVASDLDYALDAVTLVVEHRGATLLTESLPFPADSDRRTFQGRFEISPEKLQLKPGDQALFFAKVADNRHAPVLDIAEPNEARTENYRLIVEPPSDRPQEPQAEQGGEDTQNGDQKSNSKNQDVSDNQQQAGDQSANQNQSDNGKSNDQSEGQTSEGQSGEDQGNRSKGEAEQQSSEASEQNEGQGGKNTRGAGESAESQRNPQQDTASADTSAGKNDGGEPQSQPNNRSADGQPDGQKPEDNAKDGERDSQLKDGEQRPLDEDATDSERFERIRQMMEKQQQQQKNQANNENQNHKNQRSDSNASQQPDRPNQGPDPRQATDPKQSPNAENESLKNESSSENQSSQNREDQESREQPNRGGGDSREQPGQQKNEGNSPGKSDPKSDESKPQTPPNPQANAQGEETSPPTNDDRAKSEGGESEQSKSSKSRPEQGGSDGNQGNQAAGADGQEQPGDAKQGQRQAERPSDGQPAPARSDNPSGENDPNASSPSNSKSFDGSGSGGGEAPGGSSAPTSADQARRELSGRGFSESLPPEEREQLNFKREATDLALKYLKDQPPGPEREELLRQLNMTESQLAEFMQRWEQMAERAKTGDAKAQQQYERALRSLGLKNRRSQIKGRSERMENLSEGGAASRPPAEVEENFQQFLRNLNRLDSRRDQ